MAKKRGSGSDDRNAKCPFFCAHGDGFIRCEGDVPDTKCRIEFTDGRGRVDRAAKELQYREFCCKRWRNCEHAEGVRRAKYEDTGD